MLRLVFWFFLLTNGVLLAYRMGYLDSVLPQKSEPQRMAKQLHPERIRLLSPGASLKQAVSKEPEQPNAAPPPVDAVAEKPKLLACIQVGDFSVAKRREVERRMAGLKLGVKPNRVDYQEPSRHMVYLPPQGGIAGAEERAKNLINLGIKNYFIIKNASDLRGAISLGIFSSNASAERYRSEVRKKGAKDVQIAGRKLVTVKVAYELRDMEKSKLSSLKKMMNKYPAQKIGTCTK